MRTYAHERRATVPPGAASLTATAVTGPGEVA